MGGDLQGVTERLDYLQSLGVTAIYLNPIFASKSNHGYDTADYRQINPYFGTMKDFNDLIAAANARGMKVILDGVFNHMSSDSAFFDRYHHYNETGACESLSSPWRSWFTFTTSNVPCGSSDYVGWFGFDSIPVLNKSNPEVQKYFVNGNGSVAWMWLNRGAGGWRLDVMGDPSFPNGYWESFRQTVKSTDPNALIVGELWQKDSTLLRYLRGDRADTTMNYRLRDAVLGLLAPQAFDSKGFGDSGHQLSPSQAASRLASIYEDYPPQAAATLMNLLDSHDTARLLWQLTPGAATTAAKEQNAANVAEGKARMKLASLIQFGVPGDPTVYYGDEVGMTGADDPDDRRAYPWADTGGSPDTTLLDHYKTLSQLHASIGALTSGDFRVLLADDGAGTLAFGRKTNSQAAVVAVNRSGASQTLTIPVAGYVPDGTTLQWRYGGSGGATVSGGTLQITLGPLSGALLATENVDLDAPAAPNGLAVTSEGNGSVALSWNAAAGASSYGVYRSPVSGGGYVKAGDASGTTFTDTGLRNARTDYYVVRALDASGNESGGSNEVTAMPHLTIGWANLQWPPTLTHTISVTNRTDNVYGQVWIDGQTNQAGPTPTLRAQLGFGPSGSNPAGNSAWTWVDATFNVDSGNNDEFVASLLPEATGTYDYAYRYTTTDGRDWVYADLDGIGNGYSAAQAGKLNVTASADTIAPATPTGPHIVSASPTGIELAWDSVNGDPTLYGYEVLRGGTQIARVTGTSYTDHDVSEGATYSYTVRSVDNSFNRSAPSGAVSATAALRTVTVTFNVTVPSSTDGTGRSVYIAGFLDRLDGNLPQWDPGGVVLTKVDSTHWHITLTGKETTQLEYKYTLGSWDYVEKGAACDEVANRTLTLSYGSSGTQTVNDTVANWRNVAPCGS
jgi:glycosidase/fibronectin type 3 domain-containing protein